MSKHPNNNYNKGLKILAREKKKTGTKAEVVIWKELLKNNKPDAVIVATPNQFHEKHTISFLNAKIPVLLEKPISNSISKAKKIINSSIKNKTHLLIGYHRRHNSMTASIKKKIEKRKKF